MSEGAIRFRLRSCPVAAVVFTLLAIMGNLLRVDLFFSVDFLFGGVFAMALLLLCGPRWGIVAAAVSSLVTWYLWQHPYAVIIITAEVVFVGSLLRGRIGRILLLDMLYWLTLGPLLVFLFYYAVMGMNLQAVILVALKQGVNGIFNAFCAVVLVLLVQVNSSPGAVRTRHTLRSTLQLIIVGFVLFPLILEVVVTGRSEFRSLKQEIYSQVQSQQWTGRVLADRALLEGERQLQRFAGRLSWNPSGSNEEAAGVGAETAAEELQQFLRLYSNFAAIDLRQDGRVIARAERAEYTGSPAGVRLAVRIAESDRSSEKHGEGRSSDTNRRENPTVVLAGMLRPESLLPQQLSADDEVGLKLLSEGGDVLAAVGLRLPDSIPPQAVMDRWNEDVFPLVPDLPQNTSAMERWRQTLYVSAGRIPLENGGFLTMAAYVRAAPYRQDLYADYIRLFWIMAGLLAASVAVSSFVANRFFRALRWINQAAADLPERIAEDQEPVWPDSMIQEFHTAAENFRRAGMSIRDMYQHVVQTNRELESARGAAEASSRAKGEFIAGMSHELRTPLNAIIGYSELLQSVSDDSVREYGGIIHTAGQHLLDMINSILLHAGAAAQQAPAEARLISPRKLLENAAAMFRVRASQKDLQLHIDSDPAGSQEHYLQERSIMQVLMNLLANAVRSTPSGEIVLQSRRREDGVLFSVADTGPGIPREEQQRIFNPFYQIGTEGPAGKREGLGLGLAICIQLLEAMGSHMELESAPGQGAEFWFVVPVGTSGGAAPSPAGTQGSATESAGGAAAAAPASPSSAAAMPEQVVSFDPAVTQPLLGLKNRMREAVESGDVARIEELLRQEIDPVPEYAEFAVQVRRLLESFSLKELSALLQQ